MGQRRSSERGERWRSGLPLLLLDRYERIAVLHRHTTFALFLHLTVTKEDFARRWMNGTENVRLPVTSLRTLLHLHNVAAVVAVHAAALARDDRRRRSRAHSGARMG